MTKEDFEFRVHDVAGMVSRIRVHDDVSVIERLVLLGALTSNGVACGGVTGGFYNLRLVVSVEGRDVVAVGAGHSYITAVFALVHWLQRSLREVMRE